MERIKDSTHTKYSIASPLPLINHPPSSPSSNLRGPTKPPDIDEGHQGNSGDPRTSGGEVEARKRKKEGGGAYRFRTGSGDGSDTISSYGRGGTDCFQG